MPAFGLTLDEGEYYGYGMGAQLNFIRDFADALGLDTIHLVGNSLGCNVGAHFLVDPPQRVLSFAGIPGAFGDAVPDDAVPDDAVQDPVKRGTVNITFDGTEESMRTILESIVLHKEKVSDDLVRMRTLAANRQGDLLFKLMEQFFEDVRHVGEPNNRALPHQGSPRNDDHPGHLHLLGEGHAQPCRAGVCPRGRAAELPGLLPAELLPWI